MRINFSFFSITIIFMVMAIFGCKEDPPQATPKIPTITTTTISDISAVSAVTGGNITSDGGSAVIARGVCWATSQTPTITNFKTTDGTGSGIFASSVIGLIPNTTYFVRAYASNSIGTAYGSSETFKTNSDIPSILDYVPTGLIHPTLEELISIPTIESLDSTLVPSVKSISNNVPFVSLDVPVALNQFPYLNCAGYAVGYGMMGFLFRIIEGRDHNFSDPFSAHYIWNQLNDKKNKAIKIRSAFNLVKEQGCSKMSFIPLNDSVNQPSSLARDNASNYKLTDFYRFSTLSIDNIKYYLIKGYPIVIGVNVDFLFTRYEKTKFNLINGKLVLKKFSDSNRYGHAMLICGYDDTINAFKVLNSFGPEWGENGFFWFDYDFFKKAITETPPYTKFQIYVGFVKRPVLSTKSASVITDISAQLGGTIYSDWGYNISEKGICWSTSPDPSINNNKISNGAGKESFISNLTGLFPGTKYYVKAYAINSQGPSYGLQVSFTTAVGSLPVAAFTASPTTINAEQSVQFTDQSTNVPTSWSWTFGDGGTSTTRNPSHIYVYEGTYTVSLIAINSFGSDSETKTNYITVVPTTGTVTDIDGNIYHKITIGTQVWMAENLKTTKYRDGINIPNVTDNDIWWKLTSPGYCWYNNDSNNKNIYGALYNWYTVNTGKLCPMGWHIPSDSEWTTLTTYLGGDLFAGLKLKESGTSHWQSSNLEVTNSSGFTALPGGSRDYKFGGIGITGNWWLSTATDFSINDAWFVRLYSLNSDALKLHTFKPTGYSVRCLRD